MKKFLGTENFAHGQTIKTGILICNLGTPDAPTKQAVKKYLAHFLSDPRIVELPRWIWWPILHGIILNTRPRKSARAYQSIWGEQGSPLLTSSKKIVAKLTKLTQETGYSKIEYALGMRYGNPSIPKAIDGLLKRNVRRILVFPMYPQYASATTASTYDAVFSHYKTLRWVPEIRLASDYHMDSGYIAAIRDSITTHWANNGKGELLLFSFHGIPKDTFLAGDPYYCQCQATARLVSEELGLSPDEWKVSFQSRVGPKEWLRPYTDQTLMKWADEGLKTVDVICPGFAVDCLETLEEIMILNQENFCRHGGDKLNYIAALNDSDQHISLLHKIITGHLGTWLISSDQKQESRKATLERALSAGAKQ
jgi:ferrochelatase